MIMPGDPLILEAAEAVSRYHVAQAAVRPSKWSVVAFWVGRGQSRSAAIDPKLPFTKGRNRPKADVYLGPILSY